MALYTKIIDDLKNNIKNEKDPKYKYGPKFDKPKNEDNLKIENDP